MQNNLLKAGILAIILIILGFTSWELYLRSTGLTIDYDDGETLWSHKRGKVYMPQDKATVFIGSSRIKYDLDTDTWRQLTGEEPVQLAIEGATPLPILHDLANDEDFKGKLIIDVSEILFFNKAKQPTIEPNKCLAYYKDLTPSEKASFHISCAAESRFVFLDKYNFSTNGMLDKLQIPNRKGVFQMPIFPLDFGRVNIDRQNKMTDKFLADTNLQNQVRGIWGFLAKNTLEPPVTGKALDGLIMEVAASVNKIKSRGGTVVFVRTPSSGPFLMGENMGYPRQQYWDRLLKETRTQGIHFMDYKETASYVCPEFSHLAPSDAVHYTKQLVRILEQEKGWKFSRNTNRI